MISGDYRVKYCVRTLSVTNLRKDWYYTFCRVSSHINNEVSAKNISNISNLH